MLVILACTGPLFQVPNSGENKLTSRKPKAWPMSFLATHSLAAVQELRLQSPLRACRCPPTGILLRTAPKVLEKPVAGWLEGKGKED